jgi:hypothetical protein
MADENSNTQVSGGDNNSQQQQQENVRRTIYQGTELKFTLDIQSEGFSMADDDFKVVIKNTKKSVTIPKADMILDENENYLFTVDTGFMGTGEYWITTIAYVPDDDFDDGLRTEVQKQLICVVTS